VLEKEHANKPRALAVCQAESKISKPKRKVNSKAKEKKNLTSPRDLRWL
jgi:hypothetical protein